MQKNFDIVDNDEDSYRIIGSVDCLKIEGSSITNCM